MLTSQEIQPNLLQWNRFKSTIFDYKFYFRFQVIIQTNKLGVFRLGNERLKESLEYIDKALEKSPNAVVVIGYKAAILGFLESDDAKEVLDQYLKARPNLKTREDYKTLFIPNTNLVEKMIEGLIKAGWEPKN